MSQYTKPCIYCKKEIRMSNDTGKWLPINLDGSAHQCKTGTKDAETNGKEEMIPIPKSFLMSLIKYVEGHTK